MRVTAVCTVYLFVSRFTSFTPGLGEWSTTGVDGEEARAARMDGWIVWEAEGEVAKE